MNMQPPNLNEITHNMTKACEDLNAAMTSYVNAASQANSVLWQGFETMTKDMSDLMQETYARAVNAGTTLMSVKSPQQAVETHKDFIKDCVDGMIAGGGKCVENTMHTAKGAIDPLAKHANETIGALMKKAGAAA